MQVKPHHFSDPSWYCSSCSLVKSFMKLKKKMFCHIWVISEAFHIWMFILLYIFGKWLILLSEIISWEEDASWLWALPRYHLFSFRYPVIYMRMILIHFLNHYHNRCLIITIMSTFCQNMGIWIYIPFVGMINIDITVPFMSSGTTGFLWFG